MHCANGSMLTMLNYCISNSCYCASTSLPVCQCKLCQVTTTGDQLCRDYHNFITAEQLCLFIGEIGKSQLLLYTYISFKKIYINCFIVFGSLVWKGILISYLDLDGVGPVDNIPSTNKLHHFVQKKKEEKKLWHVTRDIWHVTCWGGWTLSKPFSSLALTVCYFDIMKIWRKRLTDSLNQYVLFFFKGWYNRATLEAQGLVILLVTRHSKSHQYHQFYWCKILGIFLLL